MIYHDHSRRSPWSPTLHSRDVPEHSVDTQQPRILVASTPTPSNISDRSSQIQWPSSASSSPLSMPEAIAPSRSSFSTESSPSRLPPAIDSFQLPPLQSRSSAASSLMRWPSSSSIPDLTVPAETSPLWSSVSLPRSFTPISDDPFFSSSLSLSSPSNGSFPSPSLVALSRSSSVYNADRCDQFLEDGRHILWLIVPFIVPWKILTQRHHYLSCWIHVSRRASWTLVLLRKACRAEAGALGSPRKYTP